VLDRRDFNEDLISSIDRAMNFLKQYIPLRYEMTGEPRRKEIPEIPYEALREAIINAVVHRDYFATFKRPKIKEAIVIPEIFNLKFDEMLRDEGVNDGVNEGVKVRLRKEIAYLNIYKYIIRTEVEKLFNISTATAERDLMILKNLGLIIFKGAPKAGKYILTDKGKEIIGNIAN
jgi:predicted HTH transcriptional regulator